MGLWCHRKPASGDNELIAPSVMPFSHVATGARWPESYDLPGLDWERARLPRLRQRLREEGRRWGGGGAGGKDARSR